MKVLLNIFKYKPKKGRIISINHEIDNGNTRWYYLIKSLSSPKNLKSQLFSSPRRWSVGKDVIFFQKENALTENVKINSFRLWKKTILVFLSLTYCLFLFWYLGSALVFFENIEGILTSLLVLCFLISQGGNIIESFLDNRYLKKHHEFTFGKVIKLIKEEDSIDNGFVYKPLVKFDSNSGEKVEFKSSWTSMKILNPGDQVRVIYNKKYPHMADINKIGQEFNLPLISLIMLICLSILFIVLLIDVLG